jgi:retron-type reverse transcriptase
MDRAKPFCIAKRDVWEAYRQVKANRGAAGVDEQSLEDFDRNLSKNLYRIWNRMCSGSYFPPPVRRVDIPKGDSGGTRPLGIPTVADRIAQMVVKRYLEPILEAVFDKDSYGYRPGKSAHDALAVARRRCWDYDWVLDLDIKSFFDEIDWGLLMLAVRRHTDCKWVLLYLQRWLEAPVSMPDGSLVARNRGTPQGAVVSPVLAICSFTMSSMVGCGESIRPFRSRDMPMMRSVIAKARHRRLSYVRRWNRGLRNASCNCTRKRPRSFIAKTQIVRRSIQNGRSTFLVIHSDQERL